MLIILRHLGTRIYLWKIVCRSDKENISKWDRERETNKQIQRRCIGKDLRLFSFLCFKSGFIASLCAFHLKNVLFYCLLSIALFYSILFYSLFFLNSRVFCFNCIEFCSLPSAPSCKFPCLFFPPLPKERTKTGN